MSIHPGPISELPHVSVDNFILDIKHDIESNRNSTTFFLSHCHTDHMRGLLSNNYIQFMRKNPEFTLFCSNISKLLLSSMLELQPILLQIKELKMGLNAVEVIVPKDKGGGSYDLMVSCIPAGHCPGSIMFLFESIQKTVLYTGDFRLAEGDTAKFKQFNTENGIRKIDTMYLDATFFNTNYFHFLSRKRSIDIIIEEIRKWLHLCLNNEVTIRMPANYGGEHIIKSIYEKLGMKVHVSNQHYEMYRQVSTIAAAFTRNCSETRIHAQGRPANPECLSTVNHQFIFTIFPKAFPFKCGKDEIPIETKNRGPKSITVNYSSHSSYAEILDFLNYLRPKNIKICTEADSTLLKQMEENIEVLLDSWDSKKCKDKETIVEPKVKRSRHEVDNRCPIRIIVPSTTSGVTDSDLDSPI